MIAKLASIKDIRNLVADIFAFSEDDGDEMFTAAVEQIRAVIKYGETVRTRDDDDDTYPLLNLDAIYARVVSTVSP